VRPIFDQFSKVIEIIGCLVKCTTLKSINTIIRKDFEL
jgi:hypothetical protein